AYTQSAISQQIAALEREVGTKLVERNARGIWLTDAGEALVRHTEAVLANLAEAEAELEASAGIRGGRVRLASFQTAGSAIVPQAIATFRSRHPGVELSLVEAEPADAIPALRTGELDLALVVEPNGITEEPGHGLDREHLLDDPMYVALPLEHELTRKVRIKLKDLAGEQWINPPLAYPCSGFVTRACAAAGFEPHVTFETEDYLAVQGLVAAGVGVALIPDLALTTVRDDIVIRSLGSQAPVRHVVATTLSGYRSPATDAMLEVLQETSQAYAAEGQAAARAS
ncbi:MAG: LysR family transcriptional regulator, partial [Thermoleophilaceae bacterium]